MNVSSILVNLHHSLTTSWVAEPTAYIRIVAKYPEIQIIYQKLNMNRHLLIRMC